MNSETGFCKILDFYDNKRRVSRLGKTFHEWLYEASDADWETCHDFIQWLFPNPHISPNAPEAYMSEDEFEIFEMDAVMQIKLTEAFERYMTFLGFTPSTWQYTDKGKIHATQHNVLRISRVLCCLRLAGLVDLAAKFLFHLLQLPETKNLTPVTLREWKKAGLGIEWRNAPNKECLIECQRLC